VRAFLENPAVTPLSAAVLVTIAVLLIFRGRLIPRRTYDDMVRFKDEQTRIWKERGDEYKAAWENEVAARDTRNAQMGELLEYARTADQVLRALREVAQK
jgi:hypothetical protein